MMHGPIYDFLTADHARIEALIDRAAATDPVDVDVWQQMRAGLLRHIAMEEKTLMPAARAAHGEPVPMASRLRLQHGAIASLLVPPPDLRIVRALRRILAEHNRVEDEPGGLYDVCDEWIGAGATELIGRLRAQPEVPLAPHVEGPFVRAAIRRALERAGFDDVRALLDEGGAPGG